MDLLTAKELLGHANVAMTMRYAHSGQDDMHRALFLLWAMDT